jgi:NAD(P)-dependent dehydrogenase (short-subunit alcohol dehydrogenase family)
MRDSGTRPFLVRTDVSREDEVAQMFNRVLNEYGRADYLINNADIQIAASSQDLPTAHFDKVLAINLRRRLLVRAAGHPPLPPDRPPRRDRQCFECPPSSSPSRGSLGYSVSKGAGTAMIREPGGSRRTLDLTKLRVNA